MKKYLFYIAIIALVFSGCKPSFEEFEPSGGTADFSKYVAIGNSSSGFMDGELYMTGQKYSIPNILAGQFQLAGGGDFKQPLMFDDLGFGGRKVLGYKEDCAGTISLGPVAAGGTPDQNNFVNIGQTGPFNNMSVPGVKSFQILPAPAPYPPGIYSHYELGNPYYARFAANPGVSVIINEAVAQNPTFFTLWVGANDVLRYALSGGVQDSITLPAVFQQAMTAIVQALAQNGAKGAIANVFDITRCPYFTTMSGNLPYNGFVLTAEQAAQLNGAYAQFEAVLLSYGIVYSYGFNFQEGLNAFVVEDEDLTLPPPFNVRQMGPNDKFLLNLPTDSIKCFGMGTPTQNGPNAIPSKYVLKESQLNDIQDAIAAYNQTIADLAATYDLALVDVKGFMDVVEQGVVYDAVKFNTVFVTGGFYSLDGMNFSVRGNAVIANWFIQAINAKYSAQIPMVTIAGYSGLLFP